MARLGVTARPSFKNCLRKKFVTAPFGRGSVSQNHLKKFKTAPFSRGSEGVYSISKGCRVSQLWPPILSCTVTTRRKEPFGTF
jgi:hypothetical protein